jgi:hypothetical protein
LYARVESCAVDLAQMPATAMGLRDLLGLLRRYRVEEVAIERPDAPLVETLLEAGITVVVIGPNQEICGAATVRWQQR